MERWGEVPGASVQEARSGEDPPHVTALERQGSALVHREFEAHLTNIRHTGKGPTPDPRISLGLWDSSTPRSLCPIRIFIFPSSFLELVSKLPFRTTMVGEDAFRYFQCQELGEEQGVVSYSTSGYGGL